MKEVEFVLMTGEELMFKQRIVKTFIETFNLDDKEPGLIPTIDVAAKTLIKNKDQIKESKTGLIGIDFEWKGSFYSIELTEKFVSVKQHFHI